jgi:hypothetical protein
MITSPLQLGYGFFVTARFDKALSQVQTMLQVGGISFDSLSGVGVNPVHFVSLQTANLLLQLLCRGITRFQAIQGCPEVCYFGLELTGARFPRELKKTRIRVSCML